MANTDGISTDRADDLAIRMALADSLGEQRGDEDTYDVFNYDRDPGIDDYYASFLRSRYGGPIVEAPAATAWRNAPDVSDAKEREADDNDTAFEEELERLDSEHRLWNYGKRVDVLAGIGEYGVLVLELADIDSPEGFATEAEAVEQGGLTGLRPYSQKSILDIDTGGPGSGRWGEPVRYKLDLGDEDDDNDADADGPSDMWVHHSRVIHVPSDGLLDDEVRGRPRQEGVWNTLTDIEKTMGSAAELAYRASAWGLAINIAKDFDLEDGGEELRENLQRWYHGLEPILRTQGAEDIQNLGGADIDPSPIVDPNIEALSAQTGIPQSVLKGNETGERATTQDLKEWYGKIQERREQFVTPSIVRELVQRLIDLGILPPPAGEEFDVEWPPLAETSEKEIAEIRLNRSKAAKNLSGVMPSFGTKEWAEFVDTGDFPDLPDEVEQEAPIQAATVDDLQPDGQLAVTDGGESDD